jgi:type IV secretory pathway VirB9-like protein
MRRLLLAATAAVALNAAPAFALQDMTAGRRDPRVGTFTFEEGQVYRIDCTLLGTVTVIFHPDEDAEKGGGVNADVAAYEIEPAGNMVVFKCSEESRAKLKRVTNIPVFTINKKTGERRDYQFLVTTRELRFDSSTGMISARFIYPDDERRRRAELAREAAEEARAERAGDRLDVAHYYGRRNRRYRFQAEPGSPDEALASGLRVSDNGQTTTFEFVGNTARAAILFIDESGKEHTMGTAPHDGGAVTVMRVAKSHDESQPPTKERWVLRLGDLRLCLFNWDNAPAPHGYNPGTGTADPNVVIKRRPRVKLTPASSAGVPTS